MSVNKIWNRIKFSFKTGYYLDLLTSETMKLLGSTKNNIIKYENGEYLPHIEISEGMLVYCNNDYHYHFQQWL